MKNGSQFWLRYKGKKGSRTKHKTSAALKRSTLKCMVHILSFFYARRLLKAIFSITYCRNLPAATTSSEVALIFNLDVMPFNQDKLMQVSRSLGSFSQLLLCFIYLLFFDLVRVAVIPTVSHIVYITFPGAIMNSTILQNYSIKPANKILIHTDRFLPLQPVKKDNIYRVPARFAVLLSKICNNMNR